MFRRPHPHVAIPPGAKPPVNPSPSVNYSPYAFELNGPDNTDEVNPWNNISPASPATARPPGHIGIGVQPPSRSSSALVPDSGQWAFPQAQLSRSVSQRAPPSSSGLREPYLIHRSAYSDVGRSGSTFDLSEEGSPPLTPRDSVSEFSTPSLTEELSSVTLESEEGLRRFQAGELTDSDQDWYKLVPEEAREALGKDEVQRQSILFEVFKSEKDYVSDLELVKEVFIDPLVAASPPVISPEKLNLFLNEVFWNINGILAHHQRMLAALFERQREQHPLIQSVADIILDNTLLFRDDYESYIKHYPLAEARHRRELRRNTAYQAFIQSCSHEPRIRKRDLITFISRPVTRLPRLSLILDTIEKRTDAEHPDMQTLPLLHGILSDFIKSTQPGIAAAESKVKFWTLCESLVYRRGEIIDMDLYDDSRTLIIQSPLARRSRGETDWHGWSDLHVALLDHFLLITREETRPNNIIKHHVASRPIPLEYLRLGAFDGAAENRKGRAEDGSFGFQSRPMFPFTVYHASAKLVRRYTLYAATESLRKKWHDALIDTIGVRKVRQESNKWFAMNTLNDGFFRVKTFLGPPAKARPTGKMTSAAPFSSGGRSYVAVGCGTGVYVAPRGEAAFKLVLNHANPTQMTALQGFNKFIVHQDAVLLSYSLEIMTRIALGQAPPDAVGATLERVAGKDGNVMFYRAGPLLRRMVVVYASRSFLQTTLHALEVVDNSRAIESPVRRSNTGKQERQDGSSGLSYRSFGAPFYVPKDAYGATTLIKSVAISTDKGLIIVDPTNLSAEAVTVVPDFSLASSDTAMAALKARCDASKPLGIVRSSAEELLVIYEEFGCYISKHGAPTRFSGYVRWETKAVAYASRGEHILLFSQEFIEVRNVPTSRLAQVIEGSDFRMLYSFPPHTGPILIAMKGEKNDKEGASDALAELVETADLSTPAATDTRALWDEWDM